MGRLSANLLVVTLTIAGFCIGCEQKPAAPPAPATPAAAAAPFFPVDSIILLAQSQFGETVDEATGETKPVTMPALLEILRFDGARWTTERVEDPDSTVFHKAVIFHDPEKPDAGPSILTIGGMQAALKLWHKTDAGWSADTIWKAKFGGKWDRLRDVEIGDLNGDGRLDFAVVTHDRGVVAVLLREGDGWKPVEIDRTEERIFVHEAELGDLDGDGKLEFYATPSHPNKFNDQPQPGSIVVYRYTPEGFKRDVVEDFEFRHAKEILVTRLDGKDVLLAAVEAEMGQREDAPLDADMILIKKYWYENGKYESKVVCKLPDALCRFLNMGDVDGDGKPELIASLHKIGLWLARPGDELWETEQIDANSGGFEHTTALADLNDDRVMEIYVAADTQKEIRCYRWIGQEWKCEVIKPIEGRIITWGISAGRFESQSKP